MEDWIMRILFSMLICMLVLVAITNAMVVQDCRERGGVIVTALTAECVGPPPPRKGI